MILTPGNPQETTAVINEAERQNIRVICVDTDAPASLRSSVVCVNAEVSGSVAAELLGGMVPPGSEVAVVTGMLHTEDHRKKAEGFAAFPQYCPEGKVAEIVEAHEDEDEAFQVLRVAGKAQIGVRRVRQYRKQPARLPGHWSPGPGRPGEAGDHRPVR